MTLIPAYGRDYKSSKAVQEDFHADADFLIADVMSRWHGKPVNRSQLKEAGTLRVQIRYAKMRKVTLITV